MAFTMACVAAISVGAAQAPDPLVGTWKLDVAKSTYKPGPPPKSVTVVIEPAGTGLKIAGDVVTPDGSNVKFSYSSMRDGKDVPVTGFPAYDTAAVTPANPSEGTIVYKKAGKTVMTAKYRVGKDAKTMTVTYDGTDPTGGAIHNVGHYVKQ
jgi:hypothetical protein